MCRVVFLYFAFLFRNDCYSYSYNKSEIYQDYFKSICDIYKHVGETNLNISFFSYNYNIILIYFEVSNFKFIGRTSENWKINTEISEIMKDLVFFFNCLFQLNYCVYFGVGVSVLQQWAFKPMNDIRIFFKIILGRIFINVGCCFFVDVNDYLDNKKIIINKFRMMFSVGYNLFNNVSVYPSLKLKLKDYEDIS